MTEPRRFPWTVDQFQRYAVLREFAAAFGPGRPLRVLDVGGASPARDGRTTWLPAAEIFAFGGGDRPSKTSVYTLDLVPVPRAGFVRGSGDRLPFKDGSFDLVAALDVLEHVPSGRREGFLAEIGRVSADGILVSVPRRDPAVDRAEALLAARVRDLYGTELTQLQEHRDCGLPESADIERAFAGLRPACAAFDFGSLPNWLFAQLFRTEFFFRRDSADRLEIVDRYFASSVSLGEFDHPSYRRFTASSKSLSAAALGAWVKALPGRLEEFSALLGQERLAVDMPELRSSLEEYRRQDMVSAVVVSTGNEKRLSACLGRLLTQEVEFDLEVWVWRIGGNPGIEARFQERFPGVRFFRTDEGVGTVDALWEIALKLRGQYVLLVDESVLLEPDAVKSLFRELERRKGEEGLLAPPCFRRRFLTWRRAGRAGFLKKALAGRLPRAVLGISSTPGFFVPKAGGWVYGPCLFFRRGALFKGRRFRDGRVTKRGIFLWEFEP